MTEPTKGAFVGLEHHMDLRVYYEDTDTAQIVYYANYLRYTERARTEILRLLGIDQFVLMTLPEDQRISFAVKRCDMDYVQPARLDDVVTVKSSLTAVRGASMDMKQDIWRGDDLLFKSNVQAACLNSKGAPTRMPADFVKKARKFLPLNETKGA